MNKFRGFVFKNRDIGVIEAGQSKKRDSERESRSYSRSDRKRSDSRGRNDYSDRKRRDSKRGENKSFQDGKRKFRR